VLLSRDSRRDGFAMPGERFGEADHIGFSSTLDYMFSLSCLYHKSLHSQPLGLPFRSEESFNFLKVSFETFAKVSTNAICERLAILLAL